MKLSTILCGAAASLALASPIEQASEKRDDVRSIFITAEAGWKGEQVHVNVAYNAVYSWSQVHWPSGAFRGPGSLGPDPGVCCILYDQSGTGSGTICNPGNSDLTGYWQFHTQKFKCWW